MTFLHRLAIMIGTLALCVGCDQSTKRLAEQALKGGERFAYWGNSLHLFYAENTGAWGGLGESLPDPWRLLLLTATPLVMLAMLALHLLRTSTLDIRELLAYSLFIGGGLGNLIDRIANGYVVDFIYLGIGRFGTNVFNVADMAIVAGALLLTWSSVAKRKRAAAEPAPAAAPHAVAAD